MIVWTEEKPGSGDKGYRTDGAYVGRTPRKYWRVWLKNAEGVFVQTSDVFAKPEEAKSDAEVRLSRAV